MLCVMAIEDGGIRPEHGPIVVTGAAGGVGSVAVTLLAGLGYDVTAVTGRAGYPPIPEVPGRQRIPDTRGND